MSGVGVVRPQRTVHVGGQHRGVRSLLPLCEFQGLNSDLQAS